MEKHQEIERSLIKKFKKQIFCKFTKAVKEYELIQEGDRIAVCISGGKDSMIMAKCIQELMRHKKVRFEAEYIVMDPGYNRINRELIEDNADFLNIPVQFFQSDIFDVVAEVGEGSPCYLCARMRRGYLYAKAQELGCNKIALGHHFDDVIETILLNLFYGGEMKTMMPKLHSTNFKGLELIRPMYLVKEADIIGWRNYHGLKFINCACRLTENCMINDDGGGSKRKEVKDLISRLRKVNPNIEKNIFRSVENVNIDAIVGYKKDRVKHSFLEFYNEKD